MCSLLRSDRQTQHGKDGVRGKIESAQRSGQLTSFFILFLKTVYFHYQCGSRQDFSVGILSILDLQHEFYSIVSLQRVM